MRGGVATIAAGLVLLSCVLASTPPVSAGMLRDGLTRSELDRVGAAPAPEARIPPAWRTLTRGHPSLLVFVDFDCVSLCDPIVAETSARLLESGLIPGEQVTLAVVGIDPRDDAETARRFVDGRVAPALRPALELRQPDTGSLATLAAALGYTFIRDESTNRIAHPSVRYVLMADGRVSRVLPGTGVDAADLRRAIVEAGEGRSGTLVERIALTCYGFDAVTGRYSIAVERILVVASVATALSMALAIGLALRRERLQ